MTTPTARSLDLSPVHPRQTLAPEPPRDASAPSRTSPSAPGPEQWQAEAGRLRAALQDVVSLSSANAEPTARVIQMQRRALAALAGIDR